MILNLGTNIIKSLKKKISNVCYLATYRLPGQYFQLWKEKKQVAVKIIFLSLSLTAFLT